MKFPEWIMFVALIAATGDCLASEPKHTHPASPPSQSADAFTRYDVDRNGMLSMAELREYPMGAHASMVDADRNGVLDKVEFAELERM
jgi:hypothetical protein